MDHKKDVYFTISEFAKLCNVSRQTLIYYDKIGVFSPEHIGENGYRHYALSQYGSFDTLSVLKHIGMPLEDIKSYMDNKGIERFMDVLETQNKVLEEKIKQLQGIKAKVDTKLNILNEYQNTKESPDIVVKEVEEERLFYTEIAPESDDHNILMKVTELINRMEALGLDIGHPIGAFVGEENLLEGNFTNIAGLFVKVDKKVKKKTPNLLIKPKGLYVCIRHKGSYETVGEAYERLLKFIDESGYVISGMSYEHSIVDLYVVDSEEEYVTEVQVSVV